MAQLQRQLFSFIVIGLLATGLDFILYWWWHHYLPFSLAKTFSFLSGSIFVYVLNKFITFQQKRHSSAEMLRFILLYVTTMFVNVGANSLSIFLLRKIVPEIWQQLSQAIIVFSFLAATGLSTIINFLGQKFWVFKKSEDIEPIGFG